MYIQIEAEAKKLAKSEGNSKGAEEPTWELFQNFSCVLIGKHNQHWAIELFQERACEKI